MNAGHFVRYVLCVLLYYSGTHFLVRSARKLLRRPRVVILTYHSFSENLDYLELTVSPVLMAKQMRYLGEALSGADVVAVAVRQTRARRNFSG